MKQKELTANILNFIKDGQWDQRLGLRSGQAGIFQAMCRFFQTGEKRGYIKIPSGVGKTNLAIWLAMACAAPRILFLVPRLNLVDQTIKRFKKLWATQEIGGYFGAQNKASAPIVVATYQKMQRLQSDVNTQEFDLVIWDEVHEALSPKRQRLFKLFNEETIHLGLTASDTYNTDKKVANIMPKIHNMELEEAIKLGILAGVQCWIARTNLDIGKIEVVKGDYDARTQARIIDIGRRNKAAVDIYQKHLAGQTCLVTTININHAIKVAQLFQKAGIKAEAVWGNTTENPISPKVIKQRLDDFRSGKIQVLTTVDLIDKGFDNTLLSALINLRLTASVVKATQRGGRVLRLFNGHDDLQAFVKKMFAQFNGKLATVVDFLDDCHNHGFRPVLFSDILKGSYKLPPAMDERAVLGIKREVNLWPTDLDIDFQVELITEVARVTREMTSYDHLPVADPNGIVFLPVKR